MADLPAPLDNTRIFSWGWNRDGQLSFFSKEELSPRLISNEEVASSRIVSIGLGLCHSVLVTDAGRVFACGKGENGRLGFGTTTSCTRPGRLTVTDGKSEQRIVSAAAGGAHTVLINNKGEGFAFGKNNAGQLGVGDTNDKLSPVKLGWFQKVKIRAVALGSAHTLAITETGLYAWGSNDKGQLGIGQQNAATFSSPQKVEHSSMPVGEPIALVAAGMNHSLVVIGQTRQLFAFGSNGAGQCGLGKADPQIVYTPTPVPNMVDIFSISAGETHSAVASKTGKLWTFGTSQFGALGLGMAGNLERGALEVPHSYSPFRVKDALIHKNVLSVACGNFHTVVLTDEGELYSFGLNDYGQLGHGDKDNAKEPRFIRGSVEGIRIEKIAAAGRHSMAVTGFIPVFRVGESVYGSDFGKLFSSAKDLMADLTIVTDDGVKFPCHKYIVSRAPKLKEMMKDTNEVKLSNIRADILEVLLRALYTDQIIAPDNSKQIMIKGDFVDLVIHHLKNLGIEASKTSKEKGSIDPLATHLASLIDSKRHSDCKFDCEGQVFRAHRGVLACRAEKFKLMLASGFKEAKEDVIPLEISPAVFKGLLQYLYTDFVDFDQDTVIHLLMLANEYQIERLKQLAQQFAEQAVEVDNVAWLFEIAEQNDCTELKQFCLHFLLQHYEAVLETQAWKDLAPATVEEVYKFRRPKQADKAQCSLQ